MLAFVVFLVVLHLILKKLPIALLLRPSEIRARRDKLAKLRGKAEETTKETPIDQRALMTLRSEIMQLETLEKKENASYLWAVWALYTRQKHITRGTDHS